MNKLEFHKSPKKGSKLITLRVSNEIDDKIEEIVTETGLSKNGIINQMIRFALDNCKIKE